MKKILLVIVLLFLFAYNTDATNIKNIDLKIQGTEVDIIFIKLKDSNSVLVTDEEGSNLFVLEYKNDLGIRENLKIFNCQPNIYFLKDKSYQTFSNVHVFFQNDVLRFRTNNYTLCVYEGVGKLS